MTIKEAYTILNSKIKQIRALDTCDYGKVSSRIMSDEEESLISNANTALDLIIEGQINS